MGSNVQGLPLKSDKLVGLTVRVGVQNQDTLTEFPPVAEKVKVPLVQSLLGTLMETFTAEFADDSVPLWGVKVTPGKLLEAEAFQLRPPCEPCGIDSDTLQVQLPSVF